MEAPVSTDGKGGAFSGSSGDEKWKEFVLLKTKLSILMCGREICASLFRFYVLK